MRPEPSLAPFVTFDPAAASSISPRPGAGRAGFSSDVSGLRAERRRVRLDRMQMHETSYLRFHAAVIRPLPRLPAPTVNCTELAPVAMPADLPQPLESC